MDHAHAHLMKYADPMVTKVVTSNPTYKVKEKAMQKSESMMHNKEQQQQSENGVIIPTKAEVFWRLEKDDFGYVKFKMRIIEYNKPEKF